MSHAKDAEDSLSALRAEIDALDLAWLDVLARRRDVVARMRALKHGRALPRLDPERERAVRERLCAHGQARGVPEPLVGRVLDAILEDSRALVQGRDEG